MPAREHHGGALSRILLVEDEPQVCTLMEHVLLSAEYAVDVAASFVVAQSLLDTRAYDLVLTDGMLPDGDGLKIAQTASERGIKALVITGYALRLPKEELHRHEYLMKPIRPGELLRAVKRHLGGA